jgi:hypothetical protein
MNSWSSVRVGCRVFRRMYSTITSRNLANDGDWVSLRNGCARGLSTQEQNIVKSPYKDIIIPDINLIDFVWEMVDIYPDRTAVVSSHKCLRRPAPVGGYVTAYKTLTERTRELHCWRCTC